ncbi:hypothetical protein GDO81_003353 [Engystomops pustulosus]|uniref:Secreted protein n=1 Tax=Engystomops pustulosus TaxID=76066 RepID=A0AAV6ZZ62_ENGPU|nr:hypothetical protein GDO81_003353 [Engystomops pustulosus]
MPSAALPGWGFRSAGTCSPCCSSVVPNPPPVAPSLAYALPAGAPSTIPPPSCHWSRRTRRSVILPGEPLAQLPRLCGAFFP